MLHLAAPTRDTWVHEATADLETLLLDHAHCEKKAAGTALNLMFRYADLVWLQVPMSELAREELEHFELVVSELERRGMAYRKLAAGKYGARLMAGVRKGEPQRLLDTLICCSIIEARSCERMKLLAGALTEAGETELGEFYRSLLASEARHHTLYTRLAAGHFGRDVVNARLQELAAHEAQVLADLATLDEPMRMHS